MANTGEEAEGSTSPIPVKGGGVSP